MTLNIPNLPEEPDEEQRARPPGRDEMNLAEFPFALLQRTSEDGTYTYEGWITDGDGQRHQQRWTVRSATGLGLPTEFDERVVVALMAVTAEQGFQSRKVPFSVYHVLQVMGIQRNSTSYDSVRRALDRLVGVTIYAEGAFWDNGEGAWVRLKSGFHIIEKYWLAFLEGDERVRATEGVPGYFVWSEDLWKSIQDGYIKQLDLDRYYGLALPLSRRLYRLLDKRMAMLHEYQIDVFELASRLGMARYSFPSQALRKLQPAFDELVQQGYLTRAEAVKVGRYTRVHFVRPEVHLLPAPPETSRDVAEAGVEAAPDVLQALLGLEFTERIACQLLARFGAERVREKLAYLRWEQEVRGKRLRSPRGWLRKAIEEDYGAPAGYDPRWWEDGNTPAQATLDLEGADGFEAEELSADVGPEQPVWTAVLRDLEGQLTRATYQTLFAGTRLLKVEPEAAIIGVPSARVQGWLEHRLAGKLADVLAHHLGHPVRPVFVPLGR